MTSPLRARTPLVKLGWGVAVAAIFAAPLAAATPAIAATTTVLDSTFSDGTVGPWTGNGGAKLAVVQDPGSTDTAEKSLEATGITAGYMGPAVDLTKLLTPGVAYDVSFDARVASDDTSAGLADNVHFTVDDGNYTWVSSGKDISDSAWTQITGTYTLAAGATTANMYLDSTLPSGQTAYPDVLIDNVEITDPTGGTPPAPPSIQDITPIKDTLPFPVGAAVSDPQITGEPGKLLAKHFDQVTPENTMKPEGWYNADGSFVTTNADADALMTYAQDNGMRVYGHNLAWYQQTPAWFFNVSPTDSTPLTNSPADQAILNARLDQHIDSVAKYLSDKFGKFGSATNPLVSFDVVNEAVSDNAGDPDDLRQSRWYQVLGESFIERAFNDANKAFNETYADPSASHPIELFYNDYSTEQSGKRDRVVELVNRLITDGVPIDGVGHQFHVTMSTPVSDLKAAIDAFNGITTVSGKPLEQAVTELDVPTGTPVTTGNQIDQGYYYKDVFDMLRAEYASGAKIFSATVWGLTDGQSWRSDEGAPLLFDDNLQAKPAYYGVTDQALPAKQRSAIVFQQGDGDVEWGALPLAQVGDSAGFQLRWSADHLTAYVSATDVSNDASDAASFTWGDGTQTATVKRDGTVTGTGVTAQVTSTADGWKAVVDLPLAGLTTASTPQFDVTVTDGATTADWNTPGTLGSLQLVEPLSFTTVPEASAAPVIDGTKDAVWNEATTVQTTKKISGADDGAQATVSQLWKGDYLYVLAEVTDPTIDVSSPNAYEQDSVEIFTDQGNAKNGSYRPQDAQMRISADNVVSFGAGDTEANQAARLTSATSRTATGYIVEARIDISAGNPAVGSFQGLDYEVNDGTAGARTANFGWAEQTGSAYQTTSRWGVGELVGPSQSAPVITTQPTSASAAKGDTVTFTAAASGTPAPTVQWQWEKKGSRQWIDLAGATSPTLTVAASTALDGNTYRAVFTNALGSATTDAATLSVAAGKTK